MIIGDSQTCNRCLISYPISRFKLERQKRKNGTVYVYRVKVCNSCKAKQERARNLRTGKVKISRAMQRPRLDGLGETVKRCPRCESTKPIERFSLQYGKVKSRCKDCAKLLRRDWYLRNRERETQKAKNYAKTHPDKIRLKRQRAKQALDANPAQAKLLRRRQYEKRRAAMLKYAAEYRARLTPEQRRENQIRDRQKKTDCESRRRAQKSAAQCEKVTRQQIIDRDGSTCYLCGVQVVLSGRVMTKNTAALDHVIPLSRGGSHTAANLKLACVSCNSRKGNKTLDEYREFTHRLS